MDILDRVKVVGVSDTVNGPLVGGRNAGVVGPAVRSVDEVQARLLSRSAGRDEVRVALVSDHTIVGQERPNSVGRTSLRKSEEHNSKKLPHNRQHQCHTQRLERKKEAR